MCRVVCRLHDGLHGIDSERALEYYGIIQSMPFTFSQEGEHTRHKERVRPCGFAEAHVVAEHDSQACCASIEPHARSRACRQ